MVSPLSRSWKGNERGVLDAKHAYRDNSRKLTLRRRCAVLHAAFMTIPVRFESDPHFIRSDDAKPLEPRSSRIRHDVASRTGDEISHPG